MREEEVALRGLSPDGLLQGQRLAARAGMAEDARRKAHEDLAARAESELLDRGSCRASCFRRPPSRARWPRCSDSRPAAESCTSLEPRPRSPVGRRRPGSSRRSRDAGSTLPAPTTAAREHLEAQGKLVRVGDGLVVGAAAYAAARALVVESASARRITLARFRDLARDSRRTAHLVLERFDADGVTRRVGDERLLRRAARPSG